MPNSISDPPSPRLLQAGGSEDTNAMDSSCDALLLVSNENYIGPEPSVAKTDNSDLILDNSNSYSSDKIGSFLNGTLGMGRGISCQEFYSKAKVSGEDFPVSSGQDCVSESAVLTVTHSIVCPIKTLQNSTPDIPVSEDHGLGND